MVHVKAVRTFTDMATKRLVGVGEEIVCDEAVAAKLAAQGLVEATKNATTQQKPIRRRRK